MKEAKELKFREPLKFKRTAHRTVQMQSQTCGDLRQRQVRCREDQPREVKSDLEECEKLLVEQQKRILLANKSKYGCGKTEHWHARCPAMTKWSGFLTSKWLHEQDLSGVVLSCFHCNGFILETLCDNWPNLSSDPASCDVFPLVF